MFNVFYLRGISIFLVDILPFWIPLQLAVLSLVNQAPTFMGSTLKGEEVSLWGENPIFSE